MKHTIAHVAEVATMRYDITFTQAVDDVLDVMDIMWPSNEQPDTLTDEEMDEVLDKVGHWY